MEFPLLPIRYTAKQLNLGRLIEAFSIHKALNYCQIIRSTRRANLTF